MRMARGSFLPEDMAWAVRCAVEAGADVVKVPYCGDVGVFGEIVAASPVPVVAAGGPQTETLGAALAMIAQVVQSGAAVPRSGAACGDSAMSRPQYGLSKPSFIKETRRMRQFGTPSRDPDVTENFHHE